MIGYGKMGHEIEKAAVERGHFIAVKVTSQNKQDRSLLQQCDVAIEFTHPEAVIDNIISCFTAGIPVVVGTTGWNDKHKEMEELCKVKKGALLYSSNFSIGVNILFELNKKLAALMKGRNEYEVSIEEIHHINKVDKPSGTAITMAEQVMENAGGKKKWSLEKAVAADTIYIKSVRQDAVVGTHTINYSSSVDEIAISHIAKNRRGFAYGAVMAAEFLSGKKGIYTMKDVLAV